MRLDNKIRLEKIDIFFIFWLFREKNWYFFEKIKQNYNLDVLFKKCYKLTNNILIFYIKNIKDIGICEIL